MTRLLFLTTTLCFTLVSLLPNITTASELTTSYRNYRRYFEDGQKVKDSAKEETINAFRQEYAKNGYKRSKDLEQPALWQESLTLLSQEGVFTDMIELEEYHREQGWKQVAYSGPKKDLGLFVIGAFHRLWSIAEMHRVGKITADEALSDKYLRSIIHYGEIELNRSTEGSRFHASCFFLPNAAVNIYFSFLEQMDSVESGEESSELLVKSCDVLKSIALQSWTLPLRNDDTDLNVVQVDRFRNHGWWVGGNALGYRALLATAVMYRSIPMIDVLAEVGQRSISTVSHNTYKEAFWNEGFTSDGAGWGHGKQALVWGYPIDGALNSLLLLNKFMDTPWDQKLTKENTDALMNFFRGSNWYYYKGHVLPCLDRYSVVYAPNTYVVKYAPMVDNLITNWSNSFSKEELEELKRLYKEAQTKEINMHGTPDGVYEGSRWFYNNDDLIKKNRDYHVIVNMSSSRCDGLESAINFADEYNFCTTDGQTLFQRDGDEYRKIIGAWDVLALPGITAREGMDKLTPVTNWRGYYSKHNFSGGATHGKENSVAGYIFEKNKQKESPELENSVIYDVKAYKSYFWIGDYFVALGAGVTNLNTDIEGNIRTTIDQTAKSNEVSIISGQNKTPLTDGIHPFVKDGKSVWVEQEGGFAYTVLPEFTKNAMFVAEQKANEWVKRNMSNEGKKELPESADILRLWVDHGKTPVDDTYGYVVYCGDKYVFADELPFTVLHNDTTIQAIESRDNRVIEAVFYEPSELKSSNLTIAVSAPAVILIEEHHSEYRLTLNDPCMDQEMIVVTLNGNPITIELTQGEHEGRSTTIYVKK